LATSLQAFPGVRGSSIVHSIDAATTSIGECIVLATNRFKTHESAHHDGPICSLLQTEYKVSINCKTWEILSSMSYICKLLKLRLYVLSYQKVTKKNSKNKEYVMEKIQFGPLLQKSCHVTANSSIEMVPVWPSTP
jgi:hypothetical protein